MNIFKSLFLYNELFAFFLSLFSVSVSDDLFLLYSIWTEDLCIILGILMLFFTLLIFVLLYTLKGKWSSKGENSKEVYPVLLSESLEGLAFTLKYLLKAQITLKNWWLGLFTFSFISANWQENFMTYLCLANCSFHYTANLPLLIKNMCENRLSPTTFKNQWHQMTWLCI